MSSRLRVLGGLSLLLVLALDPGSAPAAPGSPTDPGAGQPGSRADDVVIVPPQPAHLRRADGGDDLLYLHRCVGGCQVTKGPSSARLDASTIPEDDSELSEFEFTPEIWDAVVACVRDTYAPYGVQVVTEDPGAADYVEVMVAGLPTEIGLDEGVLGIAPLASDCSAQNNVIAFAFANTHGGSGLVLDLCATVAHEAGHVYGLDHEFDCRDPMTYLVGCGQKQFINLPTECGEFDGARACKCTGSTQNSHVKLYTVLGEGTYPPPPTVVVPLPTDGSEVDEEFSVYVEIESTRVVTQVELWLNGWPWMRQAGRDERRPYIFDTAADVPDGIIDVEVRAYDDLEQVTTTRFTVTKGEPCATADTCLEDQACTEGRCAYPTPTAVLGDGCATDHDCVSRRCLDGGEGGICTEACTAGLPGTCPEQFECLSTTSGDAVCWPALPDDDDDGGCCSTGGGPGAPISSALLGLGVALLATRRRRVHRF